MQKRLNTTRRSLVIGAAMMATGLLSTGAMAAEPLKIGVVLPMSGPFASTGVQSMAAINQYIKKNGDTVAGRKVQIILKDDGGVSPDVTKRLAQELATRDKVDVLLGFGLTPLAMASAPVATQAKIPMVVTAAATSSIVQRSPYIVRTGFTLPQITTPVARWALRSGIKSVVTMVSDYGPGMDAEKVFVKEFEAGGGKILETLRTPLRNPDYAPFLQRVRNAKPEAVFIFVPSGEGAAVMKQFDERGLKEAGIRLIGTGDVVDDDLMDSIGAASDGVITSFHYSAAHDSVKNKEYVAAIARDNKGMRASFHGVGAYDGMHAVYEAVKKTNGKASGEELVNAMKGLSWTSVRGPVRIDAETRDMVQNVYMRKAQNVGGKWYNVEFDKLDMFKDPGI